MSISRKLFIGIATFIIGFVVLAIVAFIAFMPDYVESVKQNEMKSVAEQIKVEPVETLDDLVRDLSASSDLSISILSSEGSMMGSEDRGRGRGRVAGGFGSMLQHANESEIQEYYQASHSNLNTKFIVYKDASDPNFIVFIMRPVQSVDDVVDVAKQFLIWIAVLAISFGLAFSYIYSKKFVNPILELNRIANNMSELDFSNVYEGTDTDEIDQLGESINHLSKQLSHALSSLEDELKHSEKLNILQKQFLADASHELKTPLAVVLGNVEQLQERTNAVNGTGQYISTIINEAEHMNAIIGNLLKLSELDSEMYLMQIEEVDLASIFDEVLHSLSALINEKALQIDYNLEESLPIAADEKNIEVVVRNVVTNAIVHSPTGAHVSVKSTTSDATIKVEVYNDVENDTELDLSKVFDRFSKGLSLTRNKRSTGLGLSIVKRILDLHQVHHGIKKQGKGVLFYMHFNRSVVHTDKT